MANFPVPVGDTVALSFTVFDVDGITPLAGLVDGDFTKLLLLNNAVQANAIAVAECPGAPGTYTVTFIPDQPGTWYVELRADTFDEHVFGGYVQAGVDATFAYPVVTGRATLCP